MCYQINVSSTSIVLLQFQNKQKHKKDQYLVNSEFDQKSVLNKKDVKFNSTSDMPIKLYVS